MKKIESFKVWYNGQEIDASLFNLVVAGGILGRSAMFNYGLYSEIDNIPADLLQSGSLSMDGVDYENWGNDDEYAWDWAAQKLNLTIVGNN